MSGTHAKWIVGLAVGVLLALPASALARPFDDADTAHYNEALAYWGVSAPGACATLTASVEDLREGIGGQATQPGPEESDIACSLRISDSLLPCQERAVMRHEVGHLLGYAHSDDPNSFMHSPPPDDRLCTEERASRELARVQLALPRERRRCHRLHRLAHHRSGLAWYFRIEFRACGSWLRRLHTEVRELAAT